ncbi:MAG: Uma2 family endonuclease [Minicystis sp.]
MQHARTERPGEPEMTLSQWADMDEDERGELVDGHLVEEEEVGALHDAIVAWLVGLFSRWLGPRGVILVSDTRFGVSSRRGRKPDASVYFPGRKPPAHGLVTTPPDIMIEVVSPRPKDARRDRVEKMNEYAAFGVRFYWIVDPALRSFELFELDAGGRYVKIVGALEGTIESIPGCEGLSIDLDVLWSLADELESED